MNNIEQIYKTIDLIVDSFKKHRRNNDFVNLLTDGLALLEFIPQFINYSVEQESEYRKFEAGLIDEVDENKKKLTGSYCETKAKATSFYKEWSKAKMFIDLMYEMVNLSKKLAGSVDLSLQASKNK